MTVESDIDNVISVGDKEFGHIDILVNNAGVAVVGSITDLSVEDWNKVLSVDITGMFEFSKKVIKCNSTRVFPIRNDYTNIFR